MDYKPSLKDRWPDTYFENRQGNDHSRQLQFRLDEQFIKKYISNGLICDIGCSTGEFLRSLRWDGDYYGMEINDAARKLASDIISFDKNIFTEVEYFDLVLFRGTIQHVDEPFRMIKAAYRSLRPGGYICFLATPNANSVLYRCKGTLPFLDPLTNFYIPGDRELKNALTNYGFKWCATEYPYLNTPYCKVISDHLKFFGNLLTSKFLPHAFWRSSMNMIARK